MDESDRLISLKEVMALFSVGSSTIYRWIADRGFPRAIQFSPTIARWKLSEVNEWIRAQEERASVKGHRALAR